MWVANVLIIQLIIFSWDISLALVLPLAHFIVSRFHSFHFLVSQVSPLN